MDSAASSPPSTAPAPAPVPVPVAVALPVAATATTRWQWLRCARDTLVNMAQVTHIEKNDHKITLHFANGKHVDCQFAGRNECNAWWATILRFVQANTL